MNRLSFQRILILCFVFALGGSFCYAQSANKDAPGAQNTEVLGENERLPFMQTEQSSEVREPSSSGLLLKTLGSMLLIVGLIFFAAWGAKKLGFGGSKSNSDDQDLAILSSVSLGNGRTISTVRFGERVLVVGSTPQSFTLLAEETCGEKSHLRTSRSVAEMLAEENDSFNDKFEQAQARVTGWGERGEEI
jgi:flagellar biosynthetic protein FliO